MKKFTVTSLLFLLVFYSVADFIFSAEPAQAQLPVTVVADATAQAQSIGEMIATGWKIAVINAVQQAVAYFMRKIAYDSAVWLASGGKGQSGFSHKTGFYDYMSDVAGEAAGTAIDQLGKGFGLDLCKIPDIKLDLALRIGLHFKYGAPQKPRCDLQTFKKNWNGDAWKSKYGNKNGGFDPGKMFAGSMKLEDTDLGITMKTTEKIDRLTAAQTNSAKADRGEGGGFKPATNLIDGNIKQPSALVKQKAEANTDTEQNKRDQNQMAAAMGSGAWQTLPSTLSLFLNTLAGELLKHFKESGSLFGVCLPGNSLTAGIYGAGKGDCTPTDVAQNPDSTGQITGRAAAEATFSGFLVTHLDAVGNYDDKLLAQLGADYCKDKTHGRGLYDCRADASLIQALQESKTGDPVTIQEAMVKGWLHPDWKLIPHSGHEVEDGDCYGRNFYCESDIKVLRQLRIFPVGFELAAAQKDTTNPHVLYTLQDAINGYYDPTNVKFYHLLDPNWVIKLPLTRCDAEGYGPEPLGQDVPDRIKECVQLKTCIGNDSQGNCAGYGYCTREKNVWKFDADPCKPQFASCKAFTDGNGQPEAFLYRTLDTGGCNQNTVGCMPYSLSKEGQPGWQSVSYYSNSLTENYNTGVQLNKNIATDCSANSAGCSIFKSAQDNNVTAYLKKAPTYLRCYDSNILSQAIDWPQTFSDLNNLIDTQNPECKNYAQVCIRDEVGCQEYKPVGTAASLPITGKFTPASTTATGALIAWNDECDQKCVGYDAYREMPANYSSGTLLTYLTPPSAYNNNSSGKTCTLQDVSCESFTNMSAISSQGGEQVENFTSLRACIKPDTNKQKNFYVYDSSIGVGNSLKAYTLVKDTDGSPSTTYKDIQEKTQVESTCNEALYKSGKLQTSDCRQFNDDQGHVYYKLLSHTIVVSEFCTTYRLNSNELAGPNQCFGNGEYRGGFCYYDGLPAGVDVTGEHSLTSPSCTAGTAVSCREYRGSASNLSKALVVDTFEGSGYDLTANKWSADSNGQLGQSTESTQTNGHSLGYAGNGYFVKNFDLLSYSKFGLSYSLNFWIAGSVVSTTVQVVDGNGITTTLGIVGANQNWQSFKFNFNLDSTGESKVGKLYFSVAGSSNVYLDNLQLTQVTDYLYLVKNSLVVDPICDSHQDDNLPGEAMGCSAYQGPDRIDYLTNFSFLCRDGAVGCNAFKDTYNTVSTSSMAYNVELSKYNTAGALLTVNIHNKSYSCQAASGEQSCLVNIDGFQRSDQITNGSGTHARFTDDSFFVPADTDDANPVYLVDNETGRCQEADVGCTYAGLQKQTFKGAIFVTTTIKLLPDHFGNFVDDSDQPQNGTLCTQQAVGCGDFGGSYFKDPSVAGANVCTYKTGVSDIYTDNGTKYSGWYRKDVSYCLPANYKDVTYVDTNIANASDKCTNDGDCTSGKICWAYGKNRVPCYPNSLVTNPNSSSTHNFYFLRSYGDNLTYNNFVGECPIDQDSCTEFIDHVDGQSYFMLKNNKITQGAGDCDGQVSQKAGCALFEDTSNLVKYWDTAASYQKSNNFYVSNNNDLSSFTKVPPASTNINDANIILKVKRDRECAEWLQCEDSYSRWDPGSSKWQQVCSKFGRCDKLADNAVDDGTINCGHFIPEGKSKFANAPLTQAQYTNPTLRDFTWSGHDFDGYSVPNIYPLDELGEFNIDETDVATATQWRVAKPIPCGGVNCNTNGIGKYFCANDGQVCGQGSVGMCRNHSCLLDIQGGNSTDQDKLLEHSCRSYPEKDSPFPSYPEITYKGAALYLNVTTCDTNDPNHPDKNAVACDCNYTKLVYGDSAVKKYDVYGMSVNPQNRELICSGGTYNNKYCVDNLSSSYEVKAADCGTGGGVCLSNVRADQNLGWRGVCVEQDFSRTLNGQQNKFPCLTWLPIDQLQGEQDINFTFPDAAAKLAANSKYCLAGKLYQQPKQFGHCEDLNFSFLNGGCSEQQCHDIGTLYCQERPGFHLKDDKGVCGGKTEVEGYNCNGGITKDCRYECVPDDNINNKWIDQPGLASASSTGIGCQIGLNIGSSDIAFTNNIWKGNGFNSQTFNLEVKNKGSAYNNILNFNYSSPNTQFALVGPNYNLAANGTLIDLMYCKTNTGLNMPNSDGSCGSGDKQGSNLTYGTWHVDKETCSNDADCSGNKGVTCNGYDAGMKCKVTCKSDADCVGELDYTDSPTSPAFGTFSLGHCEGYIPPTIVAGTSANNAVAGHCENYADLPTPGSVNSYCDKTIIVGLTGGSMSPTHCEDFHRKGGGVVINNQEISGIGTCENVVTKVGTCSTNSTADKAGKPCTANTYCFSENCASSGGEKVCVKPSVPGAVDNTSFTAKINNALTELQQLFARIDISNFWYFDTPTQLYRNIKSDDNSFGSGINADITESAPNGPKYDDNLLPRVFPVGKCDQYQRCEEINGQTNLGANGTWNLGFSVNDQWNQDVKVLNSPSEVDIKFFATAAANQMPIKRIRIDWGDGSGLENHEGTIRNARGVDKNGKDLCFPEISAPDFGVITGKTCDYRFYNFQHPYSCPQNSPYRNTALNLSCPTNSEFAGGCCIFTPGVQILDNWGWCNGSCPGEPGGGKCYNGYDANPTNWINECDVQPTDTQDPFTRFGHKIYVAPDSSDTTVYP